MTTDADIVMAVAASVTAAATLCLVWLGHNTLPSIRKRLERTTFAGEETLDLLRRHAHSPWVTHGHQSTTTGRSLLKVVRSGRHDPLFDRFVAEFLDHVPSYAITPLGHAELLHRKMSGRWGLSIVLSDCTLEIRSGALKGVRAAGEIVERPSYPALLEHKLLKTSEDTVEWALSSATPVDYMPIELSDPPRLVIDLLRHSAE